MPATTTLSAIRTQCKQRCDMVNSAFITDAEWNAMINSSYYELYDLLVQKYGDDYFVAGPNQITTDGINSRFALPADFYKVLGVEGQLNPGSTSVWVNIPRFNMTDRNKWSTLGAGSFYTIRNVHYRISGSTLWLAPTPTAGQIVQVWYVPRLTALVNDSDVVDGVSGWEEYIITDTCIKAMVKEESDSSAFMAQKNALVQRIEAAAENRDAGSPATVVDAQGANDQAWPIGYGLGPEGF